MPLPDASFPPMPQVEILTLGQLSSSGDNSWGRVLMHLFPNARRVRIAALYYGKSPVSKPVRRGATTSGIADGLLEWRMRSTRFASEHRGWRRLDFLEVGSVLDLYNLGLSCQVCHLEVGSLSGSAVPEHITEALEDVQPAHMGCTVHREDLEERLPALWQAIYTTCSVQRLALDLADTEKSLFSLRKALVSLPVSELLCMKPNSYQANHIELMLRRGSSASSEESFPLHTSSSASRPPSSPNSCSEASP